MKKILYFSCLALVLASCGGDNGSDSVVAPEKRSEVSTVYELGACNMQNASEFIWVRNENATYFCDGIQWQSDATISYSSNSIVESLYSSSTLPIENNVLSSVSQLGAVTSSSSFLPSKGQDSIGKIESSSSLQALSKSSSSVAKSSSSRVFSSSSQTSNSSSSQIFSNTFKDSRDGQTYKTVTIGSQTWMAENLNYKTKNSSCYDNDESNCLKYGRLYPWADAMDSMGSFSTNGKGCGIGINCIPQYPVRGVCPSGWYLPSKDEWSTLFANVGGQPTAGYMLKTKKGWQDDGNGVDRLAFSAFPAGRKSWNGSYASTDKNLFLGINEWASFWSSTQYVEGNYSAYKVDLKYDYDEAFLDISGRPVSYSVRCLKNTEQSSSSGLVKSSTSGTVAGPCKQNGNDNCLYATFNDNRDGQTYKTVTIGSQVWMAENLNYYSKRDNQYAYYQSACYDGSDGNCSKYGRFYSWKVINQNVCPTGWHIPTKDDFEELLTLVGGSSTAGTMLKSSNGWKGNGNGIDAYGFSILPAGFYFLDAGEKDICGGSDARDCCVNGGREYDADGHESHFWSSTKDGSSLYQLVINYQWDFIQLSKRKVYAVLNDPETGCISTEIWANIRCIKDK